MGLKYSDLFIFIFNILSFVNYFDKNVASEVIVQWKPKNQYFLSILKYWC